MKRHCPQKMGATVLKNCSNVVAVMHCAAGCIDPVMSALHWARVDTVIFGTGIPDVHRLGFHELTIPNARMKKWGKSPLQLVPKFLLAECRALLTAWKALPVKPRY